MLDQVIVFSKSGLVLWSQSWAPIKGDPVNSVIHQVLLEVRARGGHIALHDSTQTELPKARWNNPSAKNTKMHARHAHTRWHY